MEGEQMAALSDTRCFRLDERLLLGIGADDAIRAGGALPLRQRAPTRPANA
jgi:hypothetical protein